MSQKSNPSALSPALMDIDTVATVLSRTAFSPFFTLFIPLFYLSQGLAVKNPHVLYSALYCAILTLFRAVGWLSRVYRNGISSLWEPPFDWSEQIVLITGGSSGVGELLANTLAMRNVTVVVLDIKPLVTENSNITFYECDVSKWEQVEAVAQTVIRQVGHPTILVNNAGVVQGKLILDLKPQDVSQTFGVNTLAHFWTLKTFLPHMIEKKTGHIVTVASVMGLVGSAQMLDYSASKAAVVNMHEALRYELDNRYGTPHVRTTLLCPGHIHTPLFSTLSVPQNVLYQFFVPTLAPVAVVKAIVQALDAHESRTVFMPFYTTSAVWMRTFPSFVRDLAQKLTNADFMMRDFRKVTAIREDEVEELTKAGAHKSRE